MEPADRVFISYAHKDPGCYVEGVQRQLRIALKGLGGFEVWTDERIGIAQDWDREIQAALDRCACAILLISPNFLDSRYICEQELPVLLCRAQAQSLGLIPVFVSRVPTRALKLDVSCGGKTETFDLGSRQGVKGNGPDQPLDGLTDAERGTLIAKLADQVGGWLEQRQPAAGAPDGPTRRPSATPPVAPSDRRPELVLEFQTAPGGLHRRYYLTDGARPTELDLPRTDGEHVLELWEPCIPIDGDALTSLLIGDDPDRWTPLLAAAASAPLPAPDRGPLVPPRHPVRVRLLGGGDLLTKLPWHQLTYQGTPLRQSGWTVEYSPQPIPGQRPRFPNHSLAMPGPVLAVFSRDRYRAGHLDDLHGLFRTLWPRRRILFEATHLDQLRFDLQERPPRLLYYFGSGRWDRATGTYLLELPDRDGHPAELSIAELAQAFGARAPEVCFLNLVDDQGCHAMAAAGALVDHPGRARAAVIHCTPSQDWGQAAEVGFRWLEHLLVHRSDPVIAFHHAGARHGGCWSAYQDWQTSTDAALDDDLVEYFLDRRDQSEHLLGVCRDLVTGETPLRVQFRLAIGTRGNRVHDFARQAEVYLVESDFAGVFVYPRGPVHLSAAVATRDGVELAFRRAFRLAPRADLFAALRSRGPDYGGEVQVPLLCWRLESDGEPPAPEALQSLAGAVLEWTWEQLAIGCPAGLRIISLLILETADDPAVAQVQQSLRTRARALEDRGGPRPSFRFRAMPPLAAVDEDHLRDYFGSPVCWCWEHLKPDYPALLLNGRDQMPFAEAVARIKRAKTIGWGQLADELRAPRRPPE